MSRLGCTTHTRGSLAVPGSLWCRKRDAAQLRTVHGLLIECMISVNSSPESPNWLLQDSIRLVPSANNVPAT